MSATDDTTASSMGANKTRSRLHASQRKSYQLTFHKSGSPRHAPQEPGAQSGYYCITETKLASGKQTVYPSKWQTFSSTRKPLHHSQRPAQSILRRRLHSGNAGDQLLANFAQLTINDNDTTEERKVRFVTRVDQRFYTKGTKSVDQLVKLSWDGSGIDHHQQSQQESTDHLVDILIDSATLQQQQDEDNTAVKTIQDVTRAVHQGCSVQDIISLLQNEIDRSGTHSDSSASPDDWLTSLYKDVKQQLHKMKQTESSTQSSEQDKHNLTQIHKLLNIYKHAESAIASARAMKQWSRFEVRVESISHLETLTSVSAEPLVADMYHSSNKQARSKVGPSTKLSSFIDYSTGKKKQDDHGPRYCLNQNFGLDDEKPVLTFHLSQNQQEVGHVRIPCALFRFFSTQPRETYSLDQSLKTSVATDARVKFTIRKVALKKDFLAAKRQEIANKIQTVIGWIQRFNAENKGHAVLSSHICGSDNVSLLHAAIFVQDRQQVQKLMALGANPYDQSSIGSAMTLALNMSDRPHSDQQLFYDMIKDMQQVQPVEHDNHILNDHQQHRRSCSKENEKENRGRLPHQEKPSKVQSRHRSKSTKRSTSRPLTNRKEDGIEA